MKEMQTITFGQYLLLVADRYDAGKQDDEVSDLACDFRDDAESRKRAEEGGQSLFDYISWRACREARFVLKIAVRRYRSYCRRRGIEPESIDIMDFDRTISTYIRWGYKHE